MSERMNREGMTWLEWSYAAHGSVCCRGAHDQCNLGRCPRVEAWRNGEDPTEYRAAAEQATREAHTQVLCGFTYQKQAFHRVECIDCGSQLHQTGSYHCPENSEGYTRETGD